MRLQRGTNKDKFPKQTFLVFQHPWVPPFVVFGHVFEGQLVQSVPFGHKLVGLGRFAQRHPPHQFRHVGVVDQLGFHVLLPQRPCGRVVFVVFNERKQRTATDQPWVDGHLGQFQTFALTDHFGGFLVEFGFAQQPRDSPRKGALFPRAEEHSTLADDECLAEFRHWCGGGWWVVVVGGSGKVDLEFKQSQPTGD